MASKVEEQLPTQPAAQGAPQRYQEAEDLQIPVAQGTDPKFRRNHRHALHGNMKALKEAKEGKRDTV